MVVVVVQIDALFLQPGGGLVRLLGEVHGLLVAAHAGHRQHADAQHIAVQLAAVLNDLLEIVRVVQIFAGHAGHHGRHGSGAGRNIHAKLVDGLAETRHVLRRHGHLRDLDAVITDIRKLLHCVKRVEAGHFGGGDGAHLNADQTFFHKFCSFFFRFLRPCTLTAPHCRPCGLPPAQRR